MDFNNNFINNSISDLYNSGNNCNNVNIKKAARGVILLCGLMFSVFSVTYLFVFQKDILEALHFSLAHGKTVFVPFASALVITVILLLLRWGINALLGLKGAFRSLAYLPSFLVLMALTDVGRSVYNSHYHTVWGWLLPLLIVAFAGVGFMVRRIVRSDMSMGLSSLGMYISNIIIMLAFSMITILNGTTDKSMHRELEMEHLLKKGKNMEALKTAEKAYDPTRTLTALRMLAMSKEGVVGDRLFDYPQYYKADGLFFDNDSTKTLRYTNDSIYSHLGDRPKYGESPQDFLKRICDSETGSYKAAEYYMAAMLLNKRLDSFCEVLNGYFVKGDTLPKYYREAVVLYLDCNPDWKSDVLTDSIGLKETELRFREYKEKQKSGYGSSNEEKNRMRRAFGKTYWWYYDYQE